MARFYGRVGYAEDVETDPGVWEKQITEINYFGDIIRNTRRYGTEDTINGVLTVGNSISILADAYAFEHFFAIVYVEWSGTLWIVSEVEVQRPRLLLRLGGVYNGNTSTTTNNI